MLESIYIENFAIIDRLEINFLDGMSVLTGETGAGKSIIIDAIGQLMGNRSQSTFIKASKDECFIEGVFTIKDNSLIKEQLKEYRIEYLDKLVVSKSFNRANKTTIKINYRNVSMMVLKSIMINLIDIHCQFETHSLFNSNNHITILDNFIGNKLTLLLDNYNNVYQEYISCNKAYQKSLNDELSDEQLEFYQASLDEINSIDFESFNEEELEEEKRLLLNYEKINEKIKLYQKDMDNSLNSLSNAINQLDIIKDNNQFNKSYEIIYDLYYNLIDVNEEIMDSYHNTSFDEYRLNEIQDILFKLNRLKRKYGNSINSILETKEELISKIDNFTNREEHLFKLKQKVEQTFIECSEIATKITEIRKKEAKKFSELVTKQLKSLYLDKVVFYVDFNKIDLQKSGQDKIEFLISTNSGQTLKPLNKVASGGELSRIMLAIKILSLSYSTIETIIFDEADTGVSGKVAESIGAIMKKIGKSHQVLCITHLAQVAAFGDHHFLIEKISKNNDTNVVVNELDENNSIYEIAKMISGKEISNESIEHAKKLKNN